VVTTSSDIQITGNQHITRGQLLSVFGADLERNIFRVPMEERRADLERLPWVAHATVMRLLPNQIRIAVTERTPVAFTRQGSQIGLVDANGVLLDMPPNAAGDPHYSFPVLTGLSANDPLSTRAARMVIYRRFMGELDSSGENVTKSISEVDVSNPEDVKALVATGSSDILVHFGDEQFLERYHQFQQHLAEWKQQYPKLASADMRYERQVVLEMQPGTGVPVNAETAGEGAAIAQPPTAAESPKPAAHVALSHPKAKPASFAGKSRSSNARIFADLAAQRRAEQKKRVAARAAAR
jgi:cell division protein FtsQ